MLGDKFAFKILFIVTYISLIQLPVVSTKPVKSSRNKMQILKVSEKVCNTFSMF